MRGQPVLDLRRLVRRAVVEHDVHVEVPQNLLIDRLHEFLELDHAVTVMQRADDVSGREVERRVQAGRAVPFAVVGGALGGPAEQRQDWLGAIQRLGLTLSSTYKPTACSGGIR